MVAPEARCFDFIPFGTDICGAVPPEGLEDGFAE